jgi:hypothetical protein
VFFSSILDAENEGYRPYGHCMRKDYVKWKNGFIR